MLCAGPDLSGVYLPCFIPGLKRQTHQIIQSVCLHDVVSPDGLDFLDNVGQSSPNILRSIPVDGVERWIFSILDTPTSHPSR